jgi:RNA polymerase sigma-70 factor (ECF subfamily)
MGDRALVRRILGGDREAGERWVTAEYPRIYRLLRHLTGAVETAEDLTQQTFLKAWQALATFRGEASLRTWLHRIAYHEYTHWLRSRRVNAPLDEAYEAPDLHAAQQLEAVLVHRALADLSPDHRETFVLYHIQGLTVSEVAAVLNVPNGTVKSRLFHARHQLRELLRPAEDAQKTEGHEEPRSDAGRCGLEVLGCNHSAGGDQQ